ncbi:sugar phosphate isomerase/epimerase family protein [Agromyces aurantiacus]|uniref:Sugar phosphate isomerase/epimerase family protein n=1 Tax=Agromyces aurantiacus TaxID=165814 RepID=A0ABV9R4V0_9MICO|nr:sugar phosphate isomerase/epimerase family protein [Agromyces aurantiacus]MBM7503443.1 sugar phosphate isomerase/epimerase [Agromyces aurantiacus]
MSAAPTIARPRLGYGTNGFADHPLDDALDVLQRHGYEAVALTLGHPHFEPFADGWLDRAIHLRADLERRGLLVVVETGARYVLDPVRRHRPNLLDDDAEAARRVAFLVRAIEIAEVLDAECVSFWSGVRPDGVDAEVAWRRLLANLGPVVAAARRHAVRLGLEPEPGMLVETVADALRVRAELGDPPELGLTVDLGHCVVVEPDGVEGALRAAGDLLVNVQVDDMLPHAHEHLELGTGRLDLELAFRTLAELGYDGVAAIELPRHSHAAPRIAEESIARLHDVFERIG